MPLVEIVTIPFEGAVHVHQAVWPLETPLIEGDIAFRQHSGGHTTGPNWPTFLRFASRYLQ